MTRSLTFVVDELMQNVLMTKTGSGPGIHSRARSRRIGVVKTMEPGKGLEPSNHLIQICVDLSTLWTFSSPCISV